MDPSQSDNNSFSETPSINSYTDSSVSKDISMVDLQRNPSTFEARSTSSRFVENAGMDNSETNQGSYVPQRRKSTMLLTEDDLKRNSSSNDDDMIIDSENDIGSSQPQQNHHQDHTQQGQQLNNQQQQQQQQQQSHQQLQGQQPDHYPQERQQVNQQQPVLVPTVFKWIEGGEKVFVMGTFTGWRKMIALNGPSPKDGSFSVQIALPPGTHRFKFVVDNEVRFSNFIPTATDQSGHFVNYLEIFPSQHDEYLQAHKSKASLRTLDSKLGLTKDDDDMGNGYSRYHDEEEAPEDQNLEYITDIPPIFIDPRVMEAYYVTLDNNQKNGNPQQQWLIPPQLPPHLENVILNSYNNADKDNTTGALSIPNHVVLNHLATTSIKNNTLAVSCIVRYKKKYVTQILYAPLQ